MKLDLTSALVTKEIESLFFSKWKEDSKGCHNWTGNLNGYGYGRFSLKLYRRMLAHRVSWIIHRGAIPKGLYVCHHCDNPKCVNPKHLFVGTQKDNIDDMYRKGRQGIPPGTGKRIGVAKIASENPEEFRGEKNGNAKLVEADIRYIRKNYRKVKTGRGPSTCFNNARKLAAKFSCTTHHIKSIVNREAWKHVV